MPKIEVVQLDGRKMREVMQQRGLTRTPLAARACVCDGTVGRALSGCAIGRHLAARIARSLHVPFQSLVADAGSRPGAAVDDSIASAARATDDRVQGD